MDDPHTVITRMRTIDNVMNLPEAASRSSTPRTRGRGSESRNWTGSGSRRSRETRSSAPWWRYYSPALLKADRTGRIEIGNGEIKFQWVIVSVDAPMKDKEASDNVAIQVWGADRANRYLLDAENRQMSFEQAKRQITEKARWARRNWRCQHRILIENAG